MIPLITREQVEKDIAQLSSGLEKNMGMSIMMAFKCIKCGQIIDSSYDAILHAHHCKLSKEYDSERLKTNG